MTPADRIRRAHRTGWTIATILSLTIVGACIIFGVAA